MYAYDKTYDRISTKSERPLQLVDRLKYNPTTSDDPVIASLAQSNVATVYTTDAILSVLMTAPRSAYPWDIVITRTPNALYLDKRDGGPFDSITVNENAADPPAPGEGINGLTSLSLEATYVNQNFGFQSVMESAPPLEMEHPNPFYGGEEEGEPLASCAYRYRVYDLGVTEDEDVRVCVRTEVDAFLPQTKGLVTIRALNEFDPRAPGAGGAPDWRTKLDSQRGAVVATEMKNNSCKLAKWTVQAMLAGAEALKIGYVSRANPRDNTRHVVLSTASMRPAEFAGQLNVSVSNGWGIVRSVIDVCMKMKEGKYVLVKDPNKVLATVLRRSPLNSCLIPLACHSFIQRAYVDVHRRGRGRRRCSGHRYGRGRVKAPSVYTLYDCAIDESYFFSVGTCRQDVNSFSCGRV